MYSYLIQLLYYLITAVQYEFVLVVYNNEYLTVLEKLDRNRGPVSKNWTKNSL